VLAAAMWINPHIIALDEPTNYLVRISQSPQSASLNAIPRR
jgi:ATPase subunit of ABC transporter with duplicated ATPase domains